MAFGIFPKRKPKPAEIPLPSPPKPPEAHGADMPFPLAGQPELDLPPVPASLPPLPPEPEAPPEPVHEEPPAPAEPEEPEEEPEERPAPPPPPLRPRPRPPAEIIRPSPTQPLFVSVEEYDAILRSADTVRDRLMEAENLMRKLAELRNLEEKEFEHWRQSLEDVEKKLAYVDKLVAKAQS